MADEESVCVDWCGGGVGCVCGNVWTREWVESVGVIFSLLFSMLLLVCRLCWILNGDVLSTIIVEANLQNDYISFIYLIFSCCLIKQLRERMERKKRVIVVQFNFIYSNICFMLFNMRVMVELWIHLLSSSSIEVPSFPLRSSERVNYLLNGVGAVSDGGRVNEERVVIGRLLDN